MIAEDMVRGHREQVSSVAAEIADHFLRAGHSDKAIVYLCKASDAGVRRGAWDQAERQIEQAAALFEGQPSCDATDRLEVDIQQARASLHFVGRGLGADGARIAFERMGVLGERLADPDLRICSLDGLAGYYLGHADYAQVLTHGNRMRHMGEQETEPHFRMLGLAKSSCALFYQGHYRACASAAVEVLPLYRETRSRLVLTHVGTDPATVAGVHGAIALQAIGRTGEAEQLSRDIMAHSRGMGVPFNDCLALMYTAYYRWFRGDWESALEVAEECFHIANERGYAMQWTISRTFLELGHAELGLMPLSPPAPIAGLAEDGDAGASQMGAPGLLWCMGREHLLRGRAEEALAVASAALVLSEKTNGPFQDAEILGLQAGAMLALDHPRSHVAAKYSQAFMLSQQQSTPWVELRLLVDCASRLGLDERLRARLAELTEQFEGFESPLHELATKLVDAGHPPPS